MIDPAKRFKVKVVVELRKLVGSVEAEASTSRSDLLALLEHESDLYARIARNEKRTALQAARQIVRDVAIEWSRNGKLERLRETDPAAHDLYQRLFYFIRKQPDEMSEDQFWAKMRAKY